MSTTFNRSSKVKIKADYNYVTHEGRKEQTVFSSMTGGARSLDRKVPCEKCGKKVVMREMNAHWKICVSHERSPKALALKLKATENK